MVTGRPVDMCDVYQGEGRGVIRELSLCRFVTGETFQRYETIIAKANEINKNGKG